MLAVWVALCLLTFQDSIACGPRCSAAGRKEEMDAKEEGTDIGRNIKGRKEGYRRNVKGRK
jgi:hypothetical protein